MLLKNADYNFLEYPDNSFDLVFSRHSLEHSPFPVLTLMEWYRVARDFMSDDCSYSGSFGDGQEGTTTQ